MAYENPNDLYKFYFLVIFIKERYRGMTGKKLDFLSNRLNKYSIRKFTVGTASILVGAALIFGVANEEANAAEDTQKWKK